MRSDFCCEVFNIMSIKDVTAVIDAKAIKRYCDSKTVNDNECSDDCVFYCNYNCNLPGILGLDDENAYVRAKKQIDKKLHELSK